MTKNSRVNVKFAKWILQVIMSLGHCVIRSKDTAHRVVI
jgi:hypothetical protein